MPQHESAAAAGSLKLLLENIRELLRVPRDCLLIARRVAASAVEKLLRRHLGTLTKSMDQLMHEAHRRGVCSNDLLVQCLQREPARQSREIVSTIVRQIG